MCGQYLHMTDHATMKLEKHYTWWVERRWYIPNKSHFTRLATGLLLVSNAWIQHTIVQCWWCFLRQWCSIRCWQASWHRIAGRWSSSLVSLLFREAFSQLYNFFHSLVNSFLIIREYGSTLYVGLARDVSPTNTNFRLTYLLTRLQVALYEDLAV